MVVAAAYASLKTVHWTVFRALGVPRPPSGRIIFYGNEILGEEI